VSIAAPGLKKDDFKIYFQGEMLTISSEKEDEKEEKDEQYTRREYSFSAFNRTFTLPEDIDKEKIAARYEDGELHIFLPRLRNAATSVSKKIDVK
jgi:HSP20 family protein